MKIRLDFIQFVVAEIHINQSEQNRGIFKFLISASANQALVFREISTVLLWANQLFPDIIWLKYNYYMKNVS